VDFRVILTSSLVVWLDAVRYVWNPDRPSMVHTLRKQIIPEIRLAGDSLTASINCLPSLATVNKNNNIYLKNDTINSHLLSHRN